MTNAEELEGSIAIIGMSGRFPGAANIEAFWDNLRAGVESITPLSEQQLLNAGESLDNIRDPKYVPAAAILDGIDQFDAGLFSMSPIDAAVFDPQHRAFLECAFETFEHAGYVGARVDGAVGVYAACGDATYMFNNVLSNQQIKQSVGEWLIRHTGNDTNFLATRVSYEFDLRGPAMSVQTACSSTLVAVHLACQSILSGESDMALAGGAVISPTPGRGYLFQEGEILSPDGHCRTFDAESAGTVLSSAAGCVLLKPLDAAIDDGDNVLAVIRGSAVNNDGADKVGYLAPSVSGQALVVAEALAISGVDARDVSFLEAHGTGTLIGDPIEIAGATEAYRETTADTQFCAIGSVKSNIGHAGEAAGIASLIKTVLALQHHEIPATLHFEKPNPQAHFETSPFYVNAELTPWNPPNSRPRIAGVTGLGAGGTNAHVIVQEAPSRVSSDRPERKEQLVTVSARSAEAADQQAQDLAEYLRANPDLQLADVAFTRLVGRRQFRFSRAVVASTPLEAAEQLAAEQPNTTITGERDGPPSSVVFMMPGGGAQYAGMGRDLYDSEPVYRQAIDTCCDFINPQLGLDLRNLLFPDADADLDAASRRLERPSVALPALFVTGYATAKLLDSWGIEPHAMIGHSAGEYVVACLAGVMTVHDGLALVALRGRLFETLPSGSMLSVPLASEEVLARMPDGLSLAVANAPEISVVAGPSELIAEMEAELAADDIDCLRLHIDVAAHSSMLDPILDEFRAFCRTVPLSAPITRYVSNLTGTWITNEQAMDPDYWVRHLRETVQFGVGINTILAEPNQVLLEIGPGRTLVALSRYAESQPAAARPMLRHPQEQSSDVRFALTAVGAAWAAGAEIDAERLIGGTARQRIPLPTYPFEHRRYWVDPDPVSDQPVASGAALQKRHDVATWFSIPNWHRSVPSEVPTGQLGPSLVISDGGPFSEVVEQRLTEVGSRCISVTFGRGFLVLGRDRYMVNPAWPDDWMELIDQLRSSGNLPDQIIHMTAVGPSRGRHRDRSDLMLSFDSTVKTDHLSLLLLAAALGGVDQQIRLAVVTSGVHEVGGTEVTRPERALLHGTCRVIPREYTHINSLAIDIDHVAHRAGHRFRWQQPHRSEQSAEDTAARLVDEVLSSSNDDVVAYRNDQRWIRNFEPVQIPPSIPQWNASGVYLITGGLGGIGLTIADHIAATAPGATLVLVGRTPLPPTDTWDRVLSQEPTESALHRQITTVQRIRSLGSTVVTAAADVTDATAMETLFSDTRAQHGRITGVVHSAGVLRDTPIGMREPLANSTVVDVKARGLLILDRLLAKDPPDLLVLCSSVSSIIGLPGQADYTAANAFLDAYATMKNSSGFERAVTINWNAWQEVGMAVNAVRSDPSQPDDDQSNLGSTADVFIADEMHEALGATIFTSPMSRRHNWLLDEHVVASGEALIPGTGILEIMRRDVVAATGRAGTVELRDVFLLRPFKVGDHETLEMNVRVETATSEITIYSDDELAPHATASAVTSVVAPNPPNADIRTIAKRCSLRSEVFNGYSDQPFMRFGPRWGNLQRVDYGDAEALITTEMPTEFVDELQTMWLHPAVLDMATGSAQALIEGFSEAETFYVPISYSRVLVHGPIPATAKSHVRLHDSSTNEVAVFDVTIYDEEGQASIEVEGFTMRLLESENTLQSRETVNDAAMSERDELPVESAMREGILPTEGVDALDRLLAVELGAQVVTSSVNVTQWITNVDAAATNAEPGGAAVLFERPDVDSEFVAPATPLEHDLALIWSELLGLDRVGMNDDFFDLGGQSLIAIRLLSRIRTDMGVRLQLTDLFEGSTIAALAGLIRQERPDIDERAIGDKPPTDDFESSDAVDLRERPHLIPISTSGEDVPLFIVHGASGGVLFLRRFAMEFSEERKVYGLQAKGVVRGEVPDTSLETMASRYVRELRESGPGPYQLGGYSGGGTIALEMVRRLEPDEVAGRVILFDSVLPWATAPSRPLRAKRLLRHIRVSGFSAVKPYFAMIFRGRVQHAKKKIRGAPVATPVETDTVNLLGHFGELASQHQMTRLDVDVLLVGADKVWPTQPVDYQWGEFVRNVKTIRVAGDHGSMFDATNSTNLASAVRPYLAHRELTTG